MSSRPDSTFATFVSLLIDTLALLVPGDKSDKQATRRDIARLLFESMNPGDAMEAMLCARAIAAQCAALDTYRRGLQPDLSDEKAVRIINAANGAARSFDAALRALDKRRKEAAQTKPVSVSRPRPVNSQSARPQPPPQRSDERSIWQPSDLHDTPSKSLLAACRDSTSLTSMTGALAAL